MTDSTLVRDPEHGLVLPIPMTSASGAAVDVAVERDTSVHRIHAQTADGSEVYVEVVSYAGIVDHGEAAAEQRATLRGRSPEARISEPSSTTVLERPATTFDFSGPLGGTPRDRRFVFLDAGGRTFRIVLDPTSPANHAIVDTLIIV